ncbi:MAG: nitroreductase, partial [Pseudomonadota bacterium]
MDNDLKTPELGEPLPATHPCEDTLSLLWQRRSTTAAMLTEPGPSPEEMDRLLTIASRVPDHRRVVPYRFIVFEGEARNTLGDFFAEAVSASDDESLPAPEVARGLATRAPNVVFVISSVNRSHKTPVWEQVLTAGAVCQNLLIATLAMGYSGQWLSEWVAYDKTIRARLELTNDEQIAGIVYLGTA